MPFAYNIEKRRSTYMVLTKGCNLFAGFQSYDTVEPPLDCI
jgi:hypothetical protein